MTRLQLEGAFCVGMVVAVLRYYCVDSIDASAAVEGSLEGCPRRKCDATSRFSNLVLALLRPPFRPKHKANSVPAPPKSCLHYVHVYRDPIPVSIGRYKHYRTTRGTFLLQEALEQAQARSISYTRSIHSRLQMSLIHISVYDTVYCMI